jgi:hypothetical protein
VVGRVGPFEVFVGGAQVSQPDEGNVLLLGVHRPLCDVVQLVSGGDQQPLVKLVGVRLGEELIQLPLGDGLTVGVSLGLDCPQMPVGVLGDQVDARLGIAPSVGPFLPQHTRRSRAL